MRPIRTISVFPTLLTLGNLICGFFAIVVAARIEKPEALVSDNILLDTQNLMLSGCLIFVAMIFDGLDGYVARLTRVSSDFGAQLDSLCDVVSFGVAPGFLLVKMCPQFTYGHPRAVWVIAAAYAACAALRLARFNVETSDDDDHLYFSGLPSPAAAAVIAGFAIMFFSLRPDTDTLKHAVDVALQTILPVFRAFGGAVDGLADSLSARDQPCVARPAKLRPRCGGVVLFRRSYGLAGLRYRDLGLRFRALRARSTWHGRCGSSGATGRNRCFNVVGTRRVP